MYGDYNDNYQENEEDNEIFLNKLLDKMPGTKVMIIIILLEIALFVIILFAKNNNSKIAVLLENNPEYILVNESKKINFKLNGKLYNGDYKDVNIVFDKKNLASFNNGMITAGNTPGSTNMLLTYNFNGKSHMGSGKVIVYMGDKSVTATDINLPSEKLILKVSSTFDLASQVSVSPPNGYIEKIEYYNSDTKVIKIDDSGMVEALIVGESNVTVVANDKLRKQLTIVVTDKDENIGFVGGNSAGGEIQSIVFNQSEITLNNNIAELKMKKGDMFNLIPVIIPDNASNKTLTFDALDKTIISVVPSLDSKSANITALKSGTTTITIKSSNGKMAVLNVVVSGSSSGNQSTTNKCYCNSFNNCKWTSGKTGDYTEKQSQIPNSSACTIYSNNNGRACFKDSSGNYFWGKYGNNSNYTFVSGVSSISECNVSTTTTDSLTCVSVYKGKSGQCVLLSTSASIKKASSSDEKVVKVINYSGKIINFECLDDKKNGLSSATVTVETSSGKKVSAKVNCKDISNSISLSCSPLYPEKNKEVRCQVKGINSASELSSCSSNLGSFKKDGANCVGTYNGTGNVTITAKTTLGQSASQTVTFKDGSKYIKVDCNPTYPKVNTTVTCTVSGATNITCTASDGLSCPCSGGRCTVTYRGTTTKSIRLTFKAPDASDAIRTITFTKEEHKKLSASCPASSSGKSATCTVTSSAESYTCYANNGASCVCKGKDCTVTYNGTEKNHEVKVSFTSSDGEGLTKSIIFNTSSN